MDFEFLKYVRYMKWASEIDHNRERNVPNPAPKLNRTPATSSYGREEINEFDEV